MKRLACNLSTIFTEVPFLERFRLAKEAGFMNVECQFPYAFPVDSIVKELNQNELTLALINLPPGNWERGDRGLAIFPNRIDDFKESVDLGIEYAKSLQVAKIHCMAGILPQDLELSEAKKVFVENLQFAAERMAQHNLTLLIEPINTFDMPNYFLSNVHEAVEIIKEIGLSNVKLQFDFYHIKRLEEDLYSTFEKYFHLVEHVQIADAPGRHEPGTGNIGFYQVFQLLERLKYPGLIGLEYSPKGRSEDSFSWITKVEGGF